MSHEYMIRLNGADADLIIFALHSSTSFAYEKPGQIALKDRTAATLGATMSGFSKKMNESYFWK